MQTITSSQKIEMNFGQQMEHNEKQETQKEMSEDEEIEVSEDRWNKPLPGHEAECVAKIKEIVFACFKPTQEEEGGKIKKKFYLEGTHDGWAIIATAFKCPNDTEFVTKICLAFKAWLYLHPHKLDGTGGNWCSGCFGSFWADVALTIPNLLGMYVGVRVSFNPKPSTRQPAWFLLDIDEGSFDPAERKYNPNQQSTACHPTYGPCVDWGAMLLQTYSSLADRDASGHTHSWMKRREECNSCCPTLRAFTPEELAERAAKLAKRLERERAQKAAKEAERLQEEAKKAAKAAKHREEEAERRRIEKEKEDKRAAERAIRDEEQRKVREAEFAARVAAVAEREKQNAEALKAAKAEKARIAEENAKLKAEAKEAARKAKFGNKK